MKFAALFWLGMFCSLQAAKAQQSWECKVLPGFLIPHNAGMTEMMSHITGFEVGRQWRIDSGGAVDRRQNHPVAGVGFSYFDLGKSINGKALCLQAFYEAGIGISANTSLRARLSVGTGYLTKQFDAFTNPMNRAIGSHVNGFMQAFGYVQTALSPRVDMQLGLGMSHFSNGNWGQPNLGINLPSLMFGLKAKDPNHAYVPLKVQRGTNIKWEFGARVGKRQMSIDDPRNIATYLLEGIWNYPHNDIRNWRGGLNVYFDRTYVFQKFQPLPQGRIDQITEIAIMGGHEYRINKLGFVTDVGVYLYRPDRSKRMYYEAVGLRYYVSPNLVLVSRLKAHLTSADFFEWGLTWVIDSKQHSNPGFGNALKWFFTGFKAQKG